ncbi:mucin-5AC isoform X1 [Drosophila albomicans]|uniref:chitinase n=1 Tax=Drosophila albomicans TaxID=7291 RepID=A0A9C6SXU9_DROAB|nr:mucin-5AC isoform X1 [Drosophila albomicans]
MLPFRHGTAWRALFLLCVLSYFINVASSEGRVVCYYTNWSVYRPGTAKFNPQNINPYLCTHLIYAFGGFTKDNQMKPFDKYQDIEQGGYAKFTGLKTYNKQLKTMIAIGGWNEASSRFSPLVANPERRQQFIKNILKFLRQNHFDGIDLDWEYPAHREGGKSRDRDNYAEFVRELRAEFERESEKTGRTRLLLTMAVPAGIEYIDKGYDVPKLNKYLDWFNVLTYDFHSSHEPSVNHHAPLYSLEDDSEYNYDAELNIDYSIKYYLKAGADRDKLVLGIPTYGRSYTLINEESTELGAPSEGPGEQGDATREKGYLAYYEICQTLKDDPDWTVVQPNENVMGPYAYRRNQWVGYDDEAIVRKKAEYVVAHGLGGIMFWAIDNDDFRGACSGKPYPLIEAAKEAMLEAFGLGINEVGKPSSPQKPSRSRGRDRNQLTSKPDSGASRQSATRRPAVSSTTTVTPRSTAAIRLTEAEGSSLYIGGRGSTTPAPPTTPDPGSDFKCEEEGFFQHPRDCKKYYWCLDSGPSGLGIVGHQFTCPSGLYFNPAADSCDFARNVPCKTKKSTTSPPITTTTAKTTTTTTRRPASNQNRVTAAPVARPIYPRVSSTTSTTTTTTSTTTTAAPEVIEYDEEDGNEEHSANRFNDAEEDPQVIKELIDLIRKVGGVEKLEKHLLQNKDGSITLKEHSASVSGNGAPTTPSTISKSLYDRVLKRPGTFSAFTRNRVQVTEKTESSKTINNAGAESSGEGNSQSQSSYSKYSSVVRGNSRQGPQNEGIDKIAESEGFLKERKQYVTINRNRGVNREEHDTELTANNETDDEELDVSQPETTTRRSLSAATPSYTSLRRARPSTTTKPAPLESESEEEQEEERRTVVKEQQTQTKHYATLSRTRGRTTERSDIGESEGSGVSVSSTTNRYKYVERTRPTTSSSGSRNAVSDAIDDEADEDDEEEYEDDSQQKNVKFQRNQFTTSTTPATTNTRKYASIGRRTTTTTTTPETTTTTATGTETAKASTDTDTKNTNNNRRNNNNHNNNNVKTNNVPSAAQIITQEPETTATTTTITNETTEPIDKPNTRITLTTSATNIDTTTATTTTTSPPTPTPTTTPTPTPTILPTIQTPTTSINSLELADGINDLFEPQLTTLSPANVDDSFPNTNNNRLNNLAQVASTTTTESEQQATRTTTTTTDKSDSNNENENDYKNNIDSEVTTTTTIKTPYKRIRTNINNQNNNRNINKINNDNINNNNAEAVNEASPNVGNSKGLSSVNPSVNSIRTNYSGRRQPQRTSQLELTTTTTTELPSISSPRPFGYPRRRTRPVATKTQTQTAQSTSTTTNNNTTTTTNSTVNVNENDNNENKTLTDVAKTRTRLSQVDRPKNRYQLSRTRGSGSTTSRTTTTTTTTTAPPTARRFAFGTRSRTQVTKLATRDPQTNDESDEEEDGEEGEADSGEDQEDAATETTTAKITLTATTTTTTTAPPTATKPTLKRVRVIKYRRPLQSIDSNDSDNDSTKSTTNSVATRTHTESQNTNTTTATTTTTTTILNSESNNNGTTRKRFRKIVRKLRPVDVAQATTVEPEIKVKTDQDQHAVSGSETTTTTRKPFHPSRSRFESSQKQESDEKEVSDDDVDVDVEQNKVLLPQRRPNDLQSLRNRLKAQQAQGEGTDGVISTRLTGGKSNEAAHTGEESELQKLRDKVKAEQARGSGEQGVINDRLKKVLAEKNANAADRPETSTRAGLTLGTGSSPRPFFRRKLVAKRPVATISTINSTRSTTTTATYKRRKNGRFDPFNSSVQNKGEGFVRTDPRGRLDANRFKQQQQQQEEDGDDDDEDEDDDSYEAQQELPQTQVNVRPALANQEIVRRPFVPIKKLPQPPVRQTEESQEEDDDEDDNEDDEEDEGEDDNEDEQVEKQSQAPHSSQELDSSTNQPKSNSPYRPNRVLPGSRPNIAPTAGGNAGNVPYNSRNRNASSSSANSSSSTSSSSSTPANRFGSSNRPRVVNRPLGVATPNLTLRPVANNYERTTPLTPLKPAPFIPSNTRSYERKYTGPSTETPEISLENSLIEDLNIDALNARNKKIFDIHSKKHTTLKPKVATKEAETEQEAGAEAEVVNKQQQQLLEENQGYVTTTPSTPTETTTTSPNPTQITQQSTDTTVTNTETETTIDSIDNDTAQPPTNVFNANANEATNISSLFTQNHRSPASALSSTTSPPPPATTLLHVFTLLDGETNDGDDHEPTGRPATTSKNRHKITASVEPKHKLIEINRIVEINSKQARLAQRKSKANQEFSPGILRVESLPHVEQLGEISVVKYVHLVDGSDIQVNDGHSTVADYTPTESIIPKSVSSSAPVRNSLPETESSSVGDSDSERNGKSLLPEVIREAFETSTISLEGLFDSARKAKLLNINNNINGNSNSNSNSEDEEVKSSTIHQELEKEQEQQQQQQQDSTETAIPATYLRTPTATTTTTATATTTTTATATAALTSTATATVSRRPVLSVRRRIINTPVAKSEATTQPTDELLTTTSNKYIRRGSKHSTAAAAAVAATAAATTTTTPATSTSNIHLSKLKTQSSSATIYSNNNNNNGSSVGNINVDSTQQQQKQHKFQAASFALRRQFQTRRLTTTASPANNDESSTEVPRTQNPLFKRRLALTSTAQPPRTTTIAPEITTDFGIDNDGDQVAKSSIQSSQFNQIPEQVRPASISTTAPHFTVNNSTRRQLIARPRRPQSVTSTTTAAPEFAPPLSRRQQSRRRPHKYIEVYNRPPGKPALTTPLPAPTNPAAIRRSSAYNDYTDDSQPQLRKKSKQQPQSPPKVVLHGRGIIECLDEGNFPHPNSCRKFISCAKFVETGGIVGWEYTCPKGLGYDSFSGMCTYVTTSDGKACRD